MSNILNLVKAELHTDLIREFSFRLDESEWGITKAISSLAPVVLTGLYEKSLVPDGLDRIFQSILQMDPEIVKNPETLLREGNLAQQDPKDLSGHLLGYLFGNKVPAIIPAIAAFSGVKSSTVAALMGFTGPLVLALLHQKIKEKDFSREAFASYLLDQRSVYTAALPATVSGLLGLVQTAETQTKEEAALGLDWFWPLLLLVVLGVLIGMLAKQF